VGERGRALIWWGRARVFKRTTFGTLEEFVEERGRDRCGEGEIDVVRESVRERGVGERGREYVRVLRRKKEREREREREPAPAARQ